MRGDAFRFDISTRRWSALSSDSDAHFELCMAALGSMLFTFGGRRSIYDSAVNGSNKMLTLDVGDPDNPREWATLSSQGDIPAPRENAGLAAIGGKLVLFCEAASSDMRVQSTMRSEEWHLPSSCKASADCRAGMKNRSTQPVRDKNPPLTRLNHPCPS